MAKRIERAPFEGDKAPDFVLPVTSGTNDSDKMFSLSSSKANALVVFFYPKDDTSGCTKEAMEFSAAQSEFKKLGISVIGVSPDPLKKHERFRDKYDLSVALVSDEEKTALAEYGVWIEKSMYGRKYMGVERSTFLIDEFGNIAKAWRKVSVPGHVAEVLDAAKVLIKP